MKPAVNALALDVSFYGMTACVYVAVVAIVLPNTVPRQVTYLERRSRADTFGEMSFVASFVAFVVYRLTRPAAGNA